jgi:MYXO-CTERM domain-containing protein
MGPSEVAGVVPAANWNSFTVLSSPTSGSAAGLIDDAGSATTAGATWSYNNPWSINIADTPGNNRMMRGYLDSGAATTTVVTLTNIPYALYDVYVYADGDNGTELRSGAYTIGATTLVNTDPGSTTFGGTFIEGTNYVRFTGLTGANFTLNATPTGAAATPRAPINGIQIVQVPEPGSLALGAMGALVLVRRRRR